MSQSPQKLVTSIPLESAVKNGTSNGTDTHMVEVQRAGPPEPMQPELVVIKKKPKCKCCVIQ